MTVKEGSRSYFQDIEEGEISEEEEQSQSQSVEEITELEFKPKQHQQQQQQSEQDSSTTSTSTSTSRVWMGDMYKYSSNYGSGLYNFAWAQAVQNKPFNEGLVRELELGNSRDDNELNKRSSSSSVSSKRNVVDVVIDVSSEVEDKEEGELEEGEIELDSEPTSTTTNMENLDNSVQTESEKNMDNCDDNENEDENDTEVELKDEEFEKRIISIIETLETVTMNETEISFEELCSQLQSSLDSLHLIVKQRGESAVGALVDQAFLGVQTINSVFNSLNLEEQKQKKKDVLRLLTRLKGQVPSLFSPEQMKEIQDAIDALVPPSISSEVKDMEVDEQLGVSTEVKKESGILGEKPVAVEVGILGQKPVLALNSLEKGLLQPTSVKPGYQNNLSSTAPEILKQGVLSGSRGRGSFGPLLDLHGDHDVDSLPSPTREAPPPLPLYLREHKIIPSPTREAPPPLPPYSWEQKTIGDGNVKPVPTSKVVNRSEEVSVQPYETDALRAVSTYQQKFSRNSFHLTSLLPSPTPSEESDSGGGDLNGEVSSSSNVDSLRGTSSPMPFQTVIPPNIGTSSGQRPLLAKSMGQMNSAPNLNVRATLKSRDPRLRLANSEAAPSDPSNHIFLRDAAKTEPMEGLINSRKNKIIGETLVDGQPLKRQKSDVPNWELSRDAQIARGMRWSENYNAPGVPVIDRIQPEPSMVTDPRKPENGGILTGQRQATTSGTFGANTGGTEQVPVSGTSMTPSLPSLLKDIATNPTMLMHLIMEQQRLAADAQRSSNSLQATTSPFTSSSTPGSAPLINVASSKSSLTEQKSVEKPTVLPQTTSTNPQGEWGKIRMKPRDPRRILHNSTFSNNDSLGSEQYKMDGAPTPVSQASKDILSTRQQSEQAKTASLPSQSFAPPDITQQFTKNLRNLADILSPQSADSVSAVTQTQSGSSQSIPVKAEKLDAGVPMIHSKDQQSRINVLPEGVTETSRPQNTTWGEVEHLFERYDDQQKAAIQRERSRRIGEQNKMFAAKKLCLVLDLDHTLLNSAKFVEVEPVHEEILRKKEEQDREKPRRHLFRFSHMGMWTKLRPGIWTFLEKASKLYELHLYTMGNKLYATEMAKVLDPTGALFAGRVISKGDEEDPFDVDDKPKSKDLEGVLGMESAVVIIDDSVKVWPHNKLNLILVERYTYFPCSRRQFGLPGPSLLEIDHDERPEDGTLASSLTVIERIHQNFFSNPSLDEVDVRNILASEQRKILAGCRILFSRIFPVGEAKPHQHPLWQTAEQFGAVCTTQIDNLVTHVVANSLGTDKVNWALSTGRYVVHPGWVEASALLYRRANENDFAVKINMA